MPPQRSVLWIDPGFVHHEMIESLLGPGNSDIISHEIDKIAASTPEWRKKVLIDHIYSRVLIDFVGLNGFNTLEQLLAEQRGLLFCSIVKLRPNPKVYTEKRI